MAKKNMEVFVVTDFEGRLIGVFDNLTAAEDCEADAPDDRQVTSARVESEFNPESIFGDEEIPEDQDLVAPEGLDGDDDDEDTDEDEEGFVFREDEDYSRDPYGD